MPVGYHSYIHFVKYPCNSKPELIGKFLGDHSNDETFGNFLKRIEEKLRKLNVDYCKYWSPFDVKPYKSLSPEEKAKSRRTKYINKMRRKYPLFSTEMILKRYPDYTESENKPIKFYKYKRKEIKWKF